MVCASSTDPVPRYSRRASATWIDETTLPASIVVGLTTPDRRTNSEPVLMPICFSPLTTRLPLGRTSMTVTVILPVKTLLAPESPAPLKLSSESALIAPPLTMLLPPYCRSARLNAVPPLRSALVLAVLLALSFSLMLMVRVSPTARARRSSNKGWNATARNIAPLAVTGAGGVGGRAVMGCATSTVRSMLVHPQSASRAMQARAETPFATSYVRFVVTARRSRLAELLQHLVRRRHHLRVDFVGSLRLDHVDHFLDDVDVRRLGESLADQASTVGPRRIGGGGARGRRLDLEVFSARLQAGGIDEVGDLDGADLCRCRLVRLRDTDGSVTADGDGLGVGGNGDRRLQCVSTRGDELALSVELK